MDVILATSSYPLHADDAAAAAGVFIRDFAEVLVEQGNGVRVLTQARAGRIDDAPGFEVHRYGWRGNRPLSTLSPTRPADWAALITVVRNGARALDALVAARRPDLVLAFWALPAGLFAARVGARHALPYRVWALGSDIWGYGRNPLTRPIVRRVLRGAERCFADGIDLCAEVERIAAAECSFLPSSRRLPRVLPAPPELAADRRNVVFIGRFHPNKGVDLLIEALGAMHADARRGLRCFLFGGGPLDTQVRERIDALELADTARVMGYASRERAAAFLEHCDALVVPSRIESIPVILSDAAQAGCPIVATNVGDMGRLLSRYGAGVVVEPEPESIREGLLQLGRRSDYREGLASMARDFSLEQSAKRAVAGVKVDGGT